MLGLIPAENWPYGLSDLLFGFRTALLAPPVGREFHLDGVGACIPARSARAAIVAALKVMDLPSGTGVAVPLYCCPVVFKAIKAAGCKPRFIDVDPGTFCMSAADLARKQAEVGAIVAVHSFGHVDDLRPLREAAPGKPIIEDCAQAIGSRFNDQPVGSLGTIGAFSFRSGKYLSVGEGGALYTADPALRARLDTLVSTLPSLTRRQECVHVVKTFLRSTLRRRPFFGAVGYRLWRAYNKTVDYPEKSPLVQTQTLRTDLALTLRRLPSLHDAITLQRRHAAFYADRLSLTSDMFSREPKSAFYNRYLYPITFASREQRDEMAALLLSQNINTIKPVHDVVELASKYYDYKGDCPVSEQLSHSVLVLPSHADLGERQVQRIAEAFNAAWATVGDRARRAAQSPVIEVKATVSMT